jgi:hypothetical protein
MNTSSLVITIIGGILVLLSYYLVFKGSKKGYLDSEYWLGQSKSTVIVFFIFQLLAAVGFLMAFATPNGWLFGSGPQGGVLGDPIVFNIVLIVFFLAAASWAFLARAGLKGSKPAAIGCSISLVITAICAILLLAGAVEEKDSKWYKVLGTLLFGITVILSDGIAWNAKFIKKTLT